MEYQENYKRNERILILPHNTLRVVDAMKILEIYAYHKKPLPDFEVNLFKTITRKEKDLSKIFNIPSKLKDKFENNWSKYWDIAPKTNMYEYIKITSTQKFTESTVVLFSDRNAKDDVFEYDYYDGSIESLEKYIIDNRITAIVMDDVELLMELTNRKNIDLNNLSFIISRMGYNFEWNEKAQIPMPKKVFYDAEKENFIEVAMIALFDFSNEVFEKVGGSKDG